MSPFKMSVMGFLLMLVSNTLPVAADASAKGAMVLTGIAFLIFACLIGVMRLITGKTGLTPIIVMMCLPLLSGAQSEWLMKTTDVNGESPVRKVFNADYYQDNVVDRDGKVSAMLYIGWDLTPLTSLGTPTCQSWAFEPTAMDNDQPNILQTCTVQVHSDKWDCRYLKIINGPDGDPVRFVLWRENQDMTLTRTEWWRVPKP